MLNSAPAAMAATPMPHRAPRRNLGRTDCVDESMAVSPQLVVNFVRLGGHFTRDGFVGERACSNVKSTARLVLGILALAIMALSGIACDRNGSGAGGSQGRAGKPGHLTGKLSDAQGRPISNVTVSIFGFTDNGEPVTRETKVPGPATEYDLELPSGKYGTPTARIAVDYNGRHYELPLAAADGTKEWLDQKESRLGMVRDFIWKIAGPVPGGDPISPNGYWGGTIEFDKG